MNEIIRLTILFTEYLRTRAGIFIGIEILNVVWAYYYFIQASTQPYIWAIVVAILHVPLLMYLMNLYHTLAGVKAIPVKLDSMSFEAKALLNNFNEQHQSEMEASVTGILEGMVKEIALRGKISISMTFGLIQRSGQAFGSLIGLYAKVSRLGNEVADIFNPILSAVVLANPLTLFMAVVWGTVMTMITVITFVFYVL